MNGITAAIYASFFLGIGQIALKKAYRRLRPSVSFFYDALFGLLLWIPFSLIMHVTITDIIRTIPYAIISGILAEALYFFALSKGKLSVSAALLGSYPIYTILFSYIINHERLSVFQLACVIVTIIGTLMLSLPSKFTKKEGKKIHMIIWPIIAAIAVGLSDALSKHIIDQTSSSFSFLFSLALVQLPVALIYLAIEKQRPLDIIKSTLKEPRLYRYPLMGSVFNIIGTGLLWISFQYTLASIASPITATSTVFVVLFAALFLNETIRLRDILGMIMLFIGIFGVSGYRTKK